MATNQGAFVTALRAERNAVVAELAAIDVAAEDVLMATAQAAFNAARIPYTAATNRHSLVHEKLERLVFLDNQFATLGVLP